MDKETILKEADKSFDERFNGKFSGGNDYGMCECYENLPEVKDFLHSKITKAYEAGVDKTIERFATGELLKSDDAQKFYDLAYEAGQEEKKKIPTIRKWHDSLDSLIDDVKKEERERLIKWTEKYMDKTTKYYGTDKHGIDPDDLIQELTK